MIHLKTYESAENKRLYRQDSTPRWENLNRNWWLNIFQDDFFDKLFHLNTMTISFCQGGDCERLMATPVVDYFGDLGTDPISGKLAAKYLDTTRELLEVLGGLHKVGHSGAILSQPKNRMYMVTTGTNPKQAGSFDRVLRTNLADVHYLELEYTEGEEQRWLSGNIKMLFLPDDWVAVYFRHASAKRFTLSETFICDGLEGVKQLITDIKTKPKGS
jgi:hypothetical protein